MLGAEIEVVWVAYGQSNGLEHMSKCMPEMHYVNVELIQHNEGAGCLLRPLHCLTVNIFSFFKCIVVCILSPNLTI